MHHRVVDQQAESDDESNERDPLNRYAAEGHAEKDDGQDERDRQCDDRAGPQSEGQKADGEHDCDGFPERLREAADRGSGDDRLIGDEVRLDPDRQIGLDLFRAPPQRVTEAQNVGALGGSHRQADGRLAVEPKHWLRQIGIPSPNRRDVSQAVKSPVGVKVDISQALFREKLSGYPQEDRFPGSADDPGGLDGVLGSQGRDDLVAVDPETRQLSRVKFEIDLFVLGPDQRDLGGVRDCQELGSNLLDIVAQLAAGEPVVEKRSLYALGQRGSNVVDLLADLVPNIGNDCGRRALLENDEDRRLAGLSVALQVIERRRLLQLLLDPIGDLEDCLVDRRSRP
jgi:hypothetical protein